MPPRLISLREYGSEAGIPLTNEQVQFFASSPDQLKVDRDLDVGRGYRLSATAWVGALQCGDLTIHVVPKIGIPRLMFLISYALDPRNWTDHVAHVASDADIYQAMIPSYLSHLRGAFRLGLLQGYRVQEDSLMTVRGRIRFEELVKRPGVPLPISVRYDEFTEDIEENRLLRAAATRLRRVADERNPFLRELQRVDYALSNVKPVEYREADVPEVLWSQLNQRYKGAVHLARVILRNTSIELREGLVVGSKFLVNMNVVFEEFLRTALRVALSLSAESFPSGNRVRGLWLDKAKDLRLKPDLSWWENGRCRFVGDAKYKRSPIDGGRLSDVYQLLAYVVATGLPSGLLVYAKGEGEATVHEIIGIGNIIEVASLDLAISPGGILTEVAKLAAHIRAGAAGMERRGRASLARGAV